MTKEDYFERVRKSGVRFPLDIYQLRNAANRYGLELLECERIGLLVALDILESFLESPQVPPESI